MKHDDNVYPRLYLLRADTHDTTYYDTTHAPLYIDEHGKLQCPSGTSLRIRKYNVF